MEFVDIQEVFMEGDAVNRPNLEKLISEGFQRNKDKIMIGSNPVYSNGNTFAIYDTKEDRIISKYRLPEIPENIKTFIQKIEACYENIQAYNAKDYEQPKWTRFFACKKCPTIVEEHLRGLHYVKEHDR